MTLLLRIRICYPRPVFAQPPTKPRSSAPTPRLARLQLSLLGNALDYLENAVNRAAHVASRLDDPGTTPRREHRRWKYAVLHLEAGVELLLKARLSREHWSLVFADVDKATREALE